MCVKLSVAIFAIEILRMSEITLHPHLPMVDIGYEKVSNTLKVYSIVMVSFLSPLSLIVICATIEHSTDRITSGKFNL